jgi:nitrate reductase NapD
MPPVRPDAELHIASLLVHFRPELLDAVQASIAAMPGTEIHAEQDAKMVVTVEGPHEGTIADRMTAIHLLDGVLSAVLVFHHVEPVKPVETVTGAGPNSA